MKIRGRKERQAHNKTIIRSLLVAALLTGCVRPARAQQIVCTKEGCHHLDESVTVSRQHLDAIVHSLEILRSPLAQRIRADVKDEDNAADPHDILDILDACCLLRVSINAESRVKVDPGSAALILQQGDWKSFLVRIQNLAGVTAPLLAHSDQRVVLPEGNQPGTGRDRWLQLEMAKTEALSNVLSGSPLEYRIIRMRTESVGKRSAVIAMDVGQGTADIGFRNDVVLTFDCLPAQGDETNADKFQDEGHSPAESVDGVTSRRPATDEGLRRWLQNMIWHHRYTDGEIQLATGLSSEEIRDAIDRFGISPATKPARIPGAPLTVLPYPGGRHPRTGFRDGAIDPQRETKVSVFTPWDESSYVVADIPEAIWSNLGLTYLAHTHVPTIWDQQQVELPPLEWQRQPDGSLTCERTLPNGIVFGTNVSATVDAVQMEMWLTNGTDQTLTDLRVQNCVMLKGAKGFESQSNDNKVFWGPYAACRDEFGSRWIISAWDPIDRVWGNEACPCLHADPKFPDCEPGQTKRLKGWLSFYSGSNIYKELLRLERTGWRQRAVNPEHTQLIGGILDAGTGEPVPARVHLRRDNGNWHLVHSAGGSAVHYDRTQPHLPVSPETHTTLSADPFAAHLPSGTYEIRIERGKEYLPIVETIEVGSKPKQQEYRLQRWINMAQRGWYSGDTHVHRPVAELPNAMLAEDLNVAFPLSYWVTESDAPPLNANGEQDAVEQGLIEVDATHVIYPINTEYEIFQVGNRRHTLGAVLILNHKSPLPLGVPPVAPVGKLARSQGALLDLDKHSWPWSFMLAPVMKVDLFELANNHVWQTHFGFKRWTMESSADYMNIERDADGFTEWGWIDYGFQTYYALVNCGLRMRVSAGTASGVHPVQLGYSRVYVHLPEGFGYDEWVAGLNAGRSFVTTGPMLDVRFNGKHAGHTFAVPTGERASVHVTGQCESRRPLERIELIVNGQVDRVITPQNTPRTTGLYTGGYVTDLSESVERKDSFWLAVRCFEQHPERRIRFAHSNPVYLNVPGQPLRPRKREIAYFILRMEEEIDRVRDVISKEALAEYELALDWYRQVARSAR